MPNDHEHATRSTTRFDLTTTIEANLDEFLFALGRAGGADERDDQIVRWTIGGSPIDYHNAVTRATLPATAADSVIEEMIDACHRRGVPGSWHVGASMRPVDLGERLQAHGLRPDGTEPGMALDLSKLADVPTPTGLQIRRVEDRHDLGAWVTTLGAGFGEGPHEAEWVGAMYERIGLDHHQTWRHYLGRLGDRPVATTSLFFAAGVVGVYLVSTHPDARGRGIGAAITAAALRDATDLGYQTAVLNSSAAGHSIYRRLGFQDHCTFHTYTWHQKP